MLKLEKENQRLLKVLEELQGTRLTSDDTLFYISQECRTYHPSQRTLENDVNKQDDQSIHLTKYFSEKKKETTEDKSECVAENGKMDQGDCKSLESFTNGQMTALTSDTEHLHASLENGLESELHEVGNHQQKGLENGHHELEKSHLETESWRLRQQEIREASFEINRTLVKKANCFSEVCVKIKDLEKENQDLLQQATTDKKLLTSLREVTILRFRIVLSLY